MTGSAVDTGLHTPGTAAPPGFLRRVTGAVLGLWKLFLGMLLCLTPVTAVLVLGWLLRLMQRETLRRWYARSGVPFAAALPELAAQASWPNWILRNGSGDGRDGSRARKLASAGLGSLWLNLRLGVQSLFNIWVLTLPFCALWLFGWWGGWENSFNKGYEQFQVGPSVALLGIFVFLLAMTHLPLALARQAATGAWQAFYDFRLVRKLARQRWAACLGLAALYALAGLPLFAVKGAPVFIENLHPGFLALAPEEIAAFQEAYYFWATAYLFVAVIVLRLVAARIYATAVLDALAAGTVTAAQLGDFERRVLERLDLLTPEPRPRRHFVIRAMSWASGRVLRTAGVVLTLACWFALSAQLFVGQFLNHVWIAWLNHPLLQLPWLRYIPA